MSTYNSLVSEAVEDYRRMHGLTQADIAADLSIGQPALSQKISGKRSWSLSDLETLTAKRPDFYVAFPALPLSAFGGTRD